MAGVPGIAEVGGLAGSGGHAVTLAAELIDGVGGVASGILGRLAGGLAGMFAGRSVASFTADAQFVGDDSLVAGKGQRTGGMAGEAAQDSGGGIEDAIGGIFALGVSGSGGEAVEAAEPALAEFEVGFGIPLLDEGDGLRAATEGPLAGLGSFGGSEGMGVSGCRLRGVLSRMAGTAGFGAETQRA